VGDALERSKLLLARARAVAASPLPAPDAMFVIVCLPRTGSELLVDLLDSHPAIRCESELLRDPMRNAASYLRGRAAIARRRGERAWGAKIVYHQLSWYPERYGTPAAFLGRLDRAGFRIISLARRNPIEQAMSALQAIQDDRYHYRAEDPGGGARLVVAPEALISMLWTLEEQETARRRALDGIDAFEVVYEDDLEDGARQQSTVDRIATWLGLERAPVASTLERRTLPRLADRLDDYPAVARALAATRYGRFLEAE
jgi:LPS sulfotransferase NodH